MKSSLLSFLVIGFALGTFPSVVSAQPLPMVSGGGAVQNNNSGVFLDAVTLGGFTARATSDGVLTSHTFFGTDTWIYDARGQVQMTFSDANDPNLNYATIHGEVACIANFGPSSLVDGGGWDGGQLPDNNVWEVRFQVTQAHSSVDPEGAQALVGFFGSILVQDNGKNGKNDFQDESFAGDLIASPLCGDVNQFQLEPVLTGNETVRE